MNKTTNSDKKARGTNQPCRMDKEVANIEPLTELPKPPVFANKFGKKFFKIHGENLLRRGILNEMNIEIYSLLSTEIGTYMEAQNILKKEGRTKELHFTDKNGNIFLAKIIINPYQKISNESFKNVTKLAIEFGLTPTSVARIVSIINKEKNNNEFDNF